MVRLAVAPGPALLDAERALAWLGNVGHANLGLALEAGGPASAALARRVGPLLFHVRLPAGAVPDDLVRALAEIHYRGVLAQSPQTSSSTSSET
jgi:hypothetical protein